MTDLPPGFVLDSQPQQTAALPDGFVLDQPSVAADVAKSGGIGLARGAIGVAGLPGDFGSLISAATDYVGNKIGVSPGTMATVKKAGRGAASVLPVLNSTLGPSSQDIQNAVEGVTGKFYEPKTMAGRYAETIGEFAPAVIGGPESMATRIGTRILVPAVASETAGQLTQGTAAEPYARAIGGFAGAASASRLAQNAGKLAAPTVAETEQKISQAYKAPAIQDLRIAPQGANTFVDDTISALKKDRFSEKQAPKTYDALEGLRNAEFAPNHTMQDFDATRRILNKIAVDPSTEGEAARRAVRSIDAYTARPPVADVVAGSGRDAATAMSEARATARANFNSDKILTAIDKAQNTAAATHSGGNLGNEIRKQVRTILNNPKQLRGYTMEDRSALKAFVNGSLAQNVLRRVSAILGGGGGLGSLVAGGAGAALGQSEDGPAGAGIGAVALPALGLLTRKGYNASVLRSAQKLAGEMRAAAPFHQRAIAAIPKAPFQLAPYQRGILAGISAYNSAPQGLLASINR